MAKSALEKWFDRLESKAKKAVERQMRRAAAAAGQQVARGARAAVDRARVKPQQMVSDMRAAGWTPQQIQARTGVPVRTQNDILKGRSNGQKHLQVLREARRGGGRKAPPAEVTPVKSARTPGAGIIRHTKSGGTTITVTPGTDPKWVAQQQREAAKRGTVKVVVRTPPTPAPAIDYAKQTFVINDKDGRVRKVTPSQLKLAPGTLEGAAAALAKGDAAEADRVFRAGIQDSWYRQWLTPGSTLQQTGTADGSGGGPEGTMTRREADAEAAVMYDGDDGDSVIYEDLAYEGDDSDSDYGGTLAAVTSK